MKAIKFIVRLPLLISVLPYFAIFDLFEWAFDTEDTGSWLKRWWGYMFI